MESWKFIPLGNIPHFASEHIQCPCLYPTLPLMSVHASPLQEGLYTIWVHFHSSGPQVSDMPVLTVKKYLLSLNSATCPSEMLLLCMRSSSVPIGRGYVDIRTITYAGHACIRDFGAQVQRILSVPELNMIDDDADVIELPGSGNDVHISAYSGALTYSMDESIVVNYYL